MQAETTFILNYPWIISNEKITINTWYHYTPKLIFGEKSESGLGYTHFEEKNVHTFIVPVDLLYSPYS